MKIAFMGNPSFALPPLAAISNSRHEIKAVVSNPPKPMGRKRILKHTAVGSFALQNKIDLIIDQLAAKEMSIARYYMATEKWIPAINRLKIVVSKYETTVFVEEALHRLVEVYYKIGLIDEAKQAAAILGYNYQSSQWYERSYKVFNKKYRAKKVKKEKELGLIRKKIKSLFE